MDTDSPSRIRPTRSCLAWVERELDAEVTRVRPLWGGMTSAVHQLSLRRRDGTTRQVVLRRYVRADVLDDVPDIAEREQKAMRLLEDVALPTPVLLASDVAAEAPALLMSRLPGRPEWRPDDRDWLRGLAEVLPVLHAVRPGHRNPTEMAAHGIADFEPYEPDVYEPPSWLRQPGLWDRALTVFRQPIDEKHALMHRDYHPGNVLWRRGKFSGVVDWQSACLGPPSIDVGWCRLELLQKCGYEAASRFTVLWEQLTGADYHPAAEVALLVDKLGQTHSEPPPLAEVHEELLANALAALG